MKLWTKGVASILLALALNGCGLSQPKDYTHTWTDLARELIEVDHLPDLTPRTIDMVASFDPTGGNNDFNQFAGAGTDPGWVTLLNREGPGCIRRLWMTGSDPGHPIRIYIDGEKRPRIDTTLDELFGSSDPWLHPLAQYANLCYVSYVPISYQKSIRIEIKGPNTHPFWGPRRLFHQISVETFPKDAVVESYPRTFSQEQLDIAASIRKAWTDAIESRTVTFTERATNTLIAAGGKATCWQSDGPGQLSGFSIRVVPEESADWSMIDQEYLLQDAVLRVYYDGSSYPSIETPLGDFFANAWRKRTYGGLWFTSGDQGYRSHLPMPYASGIRFEIENGSDRPITVTLEAEPSPRTGQDQGYLHAEFRRSESGPHLITSCTGAGKYLGCFLGITGLDDSWWILEGDESMWIDGASQPAWRGTGLEDYFNGGWYYRGAYFGALYASFDRAPFRIAQYRHHQPDPVYFTSAFHMQFERMLSEQNRQPVRGVFRSVAYTYLKQPSRVAEVPSPRDNRRAIESPNHRKTFMLQLIELERMNDEGAAIRAIEEYLERYPDAEENGVYRLRMLEYRRHLQQPYPPDAYEPFIRGEFGEAARQQATLLDWFYAQTNRAIVGMNVNGEGRLFLNGRGILQGDHPYNLFVAGVELSPGPQTLAAQVEFRRSEPWFQAGVRTHGGVVGTGPETLSTRTPSQDWRTGPTDPAIWLATGRDVLRGVPDAPYLGGIPNAMILIQSKSYGVRMLDWGYHRGAAYFRNDFTMPVQGLPTHSERMTGLRD
ncbi:MAG: DUF2961 domain-containing protein [Verrucomicrobia bacterium]|nr:DUF2961 domain-containing protein [Verrucomicrobiota bacterium]